MTATEQLLERVKKFDETRARMALDLLNSLPEVSSEPPALPPDSGDVYSALGYAEKYNHELKTTEEWMKELRGDDYHWAACPSETPEISKTSFQPLNLLSP